jgi:hypothetical protein
MAGAASQIEHGGMRDRCDLLREQLKVVTGGVSRALEVGPCSSAELLRYEYVMLHAFPFISTLRTRGLVSAV